MKILAIENELKNIESEYKSALLKEEAQIVFDLYTQDIIREIYFNDRHCAVIILECDSLDHCRKILSKLPLVINGYISFEIMELNAYNGFIRLKE